MQILIRCDRPQRLASRLFEHDHVVEVKVHADGQGLLVKTRSADQFYLMMNRIATGDFRIDTVAPVDDDVNSVYGYLIGAEEATR